MSFTSSEIQKKLERSAFSVHIALKQIEALKAEIADHEDQMFEIARSLYDNDGLVDAAIAMAQMSIPALEMRASKLVAETSLSGAKTPVNMVDDAREDLNATMSDMDETSPAPDVDVVEHSVDGVDLAKTYAEEFFGVEVPVTQFDLAREIKREAAVAVKQNTKNNTYASDRGKNAWRKTLFSRARADYLKNGVPDESVPTAPVQTSEVEIETPAAIVPTLVDDPAIIVVEPVSEPVTEEATVEETMLDQIDVEASRSVEDIDPAIDLPEMEEEVLAEDAAVEIAVEELPSFDGDHETVAVEPVAETESANDVSDIPFFDEADSVANAEDAASVSTVDDDHTLSIDETFFADDDVPVLESMTLEDEPPLHDDMFSPDDEDIDPPEFDPNAEIFDEPTASDRVAKGSSAPVERQQQITPEPAVAQGLADSDKTTLPEPATARRAVSIDSIPVHQRPGAPRPQGSAGAIPARPQPGNTQTRVLTAPGPRPAPASSAPEASSASTPSAPSRPATVPSPSPRATPAVPVRAPVPAPTRTHGYGAKVPAPDGLDEAIRNRDAAAAAKGTVPATPPSRPSVAPARPGPGVRPNQPFTRPSFGR